jgi:prolyl-tRNA synthetase
VPLGKAGSDEQAAGERLYEELTAAGYEVLLDDRDGGPGAKFADAELLGCPLRLTIGRRSLQSGLAEAQIRRGLRDIEGGVPLAGAVEAVAGLWPTIA